MDELAEKMRTNSHGKNVIIAGDFNAKSSEWGCNVTDRRGKLLMDCMASLGLQCLNKGNKPTFERGTYGSILDITFGSETLTKHINQWNVLDCETLETDNEV